MPGTFGDGTFGSGTFGDPLSTPPPPAPPGGVGPPFDASGRYGIYKVEVAWSSYLPGIATLDLSTLGGTDVLGGTAYNSPFGGPYDDITNRPDNHVRTESINWTYGRSDDLSEMQALQCTISGRDPYGMMDTHNPASPLNIGSLVNGANQPLRPVRVTCTFGGVAHPVLFGFLRSCTYEPHGRTGTFTLEITDLFAFLESNRKDQPNATAMPVIPYTTTLTTGAAIGMILDYIGWTDPSLRSLDDGDDIPFFEATGDKSGLQLIQELVQPSLGIFFIEPAGRAVFMDRNSMLARPTVAEVANEMRALGSGHSLDTIKNKWTVTRQARTGPGQYQDQAPQVAEDFASQNAYGERADTLTSPYIATDALALQLSQRLVGMTKDPVGPIWRLGIDNRTTNLMQTMLTVGLQDRVSVRQASTGSQGMFFVEQIAGTIQGHRHTVQYLLSDRNADLDPFILGTDVLDGSKVLSF